MHALTSFAAGGLLLAALAGPGCAQPIPVLYEGLEEVRYTRCVLRPSRDTIHSSSYVGDKHGGFPPGTPVEVTMFSAIRVDLQVNRIPYEMVPVTGEFNPGDIPGFLEKYFVASRAELGLDEAGRPIERAASPDEGSEDEVGPGADGAGGAAGDATSGFDMGAMTTSARANVRQGVAAVGMRKAEVYMALGPPVELNFGTVTTGLDLATILAANRWIYYGNWFTKTFGIFQRVYLFDEHEVLISIED